MQKKLVLVCLLNFLIAALLGLALRYTFINPIGVNHRFLTHAHSHLAMLGWVYLMLFLLFVHYFVPDKKPIFNWLFWITEFAVVGMLLSFPFQGYAAVSISFSTLHIFCSYYFVYLIWKYHKTQSKVTSYLLKGSLVFMLVSTIGVWCLGPAVAMTGQASAFYQIAIQFFLHFQFNGWFLIAVIAVLLHLLQIQDSKQFQLFFKFLIASIVLTFALPVNWFAPHKVLLWINGIGVLFQWIALFYFIKIVTPAFRLLVTNQARSTRFMYHFAMTCFVLKIGLQSLSLIPEVSNMAFQYRNVVIGFIHLTMLGVISGFLLAFLLQQDWLKHTKIVAFGVYTFVMGFILTEFILLIQGGMFYLGNGFLPYYYYLIFLSSILLPLGIGCIIFSISNTTHYVEKTY
tara:strand:- start:28937 stop:30139 length:1203 start_codon:yes stop_codon:yes gene_type:complete